MARIKIGNVRTPVDYLKQLFAPKWHVDGEYSANAKGDLDVIMNEVYSKIPNNSQSIIVLSMNLIDGLVGGRWFITIKRNNEKYGCAEATLYSAYGDGARIYLRTIYNGEWGGWSALNPPMEQNVEYLTNEMWNMKPLYTACVPIGYVTSSPTTVTTEFTATNIIRCNGTMGGSCLPIINGTLDNENSAYVNATVKDGVVCIEVVCGSGMLRKNALVRV